MYSFLGWFFAARDWSCRSFVRDLGAIESRRLLDNAWLCSFHIGASSIKGCGFFGSTLDLGFLRALLAGRRDPMRSKLLSESVIPRFTVVDV